MDILLLNQYFNVPEGSPNEYYAILPLGLICLASYLRCQNVTTKIEELGIHRNEKPLHFDDHIRFGKSDQEIIDLIKKHNPKYIGIGCMFSRHYNEVVEIATLIKQHFNVKIIIGGSHASANTINEPCFDYVVKGEGEVALFHLLKTGEVIRHTTKNLDDFPIPDYDLVDTRAYLNDTFISPFLMRPPSLGVVSSRGCPENCIFCSVRNVWGRSWRGKSAQRFVGELELYHNKYGVNEFAFLDDSISTDINRFEDICNLIVKKN